MAPTIPLTIAVPSGWLETLEALAKLDLQHIVPGHGSPCGPEVIGQVKTAVTAVIDEVRRVRDSGWSREEAQDRVRYIDRFTYPAQYRDRYRQLERMGVSRAVIALRSNATSSPKTAPVVMCAEFGAGRVVVVPDSDLFGDEFFHLFDHSQLWINICYWLTERAFHVSHIEPVENSLRVAFESLKTATNTLRRLQSPDGAKRADVPHDDFKSAVDRVETELTTIAPRLEYQARYFAALLEDFRRWGSEGFGKPAFDDSLAALSFDRVPERPYLIVFPMFAMNASTDILLDSIIVKVFWPEWLASLERATYRNPKFIPGVIVHYSDGFDSECAVMFPEMVSVRQKREGAFGIIFINREALRYQRVVSELVALTRVPAAPQLTAFLANFELIQATYALWDLIHDTSHQRGSLPYGQFKERRKLPYWMYALEELRVDSSSWIEGLRLYDDEGFVLGQYVTWAILFDRIFRFPITGDRVRNYDSLAGQILTNALFAKEALIWKDGVLTVAWPKASEVVRRLSQQIASLEKEGLLVTDDRLWTNAYKLVSEYVPPAVSSRYVADGTILDDEFPLSKFSSWLKKNCKTVPRRT